MKHKQKQISLGLKLLLSYVVFAVVVLSALWVSQTFFLDDLYRMVKMRELSECADVLTSYSRRNPDTREEELANVAVNAAERYSSCLSLYDVSNNRGRLVVSHHVNSLCFLHHTSLSNRQLNQLYQGALKNGGTYTETSVIASDLGDIVVYVRLVDANEGKMMVLLNTEMVPLDSTVSTLRAQLLLITVLLLAVSAVLATVISSAVTRPIRNMSVEAAKLAMGSYDVNFDGGNCRETAQLSATLNRAAYELSKLDKMQKDLIANLSHDLRTPLTMIAGYTEAMRDLPGEATPENMQIVIDETNRLTSLVNDMLEVSRYQNGVPTLHVTEFNFTDVVRKTMERYARLREKEGYEIRFESGGVDAYVAADETRILQVVYNLVNNAINYTGDDRRVVVRQSLVEAEKKDRPAGVGAGSERIESDGQDRASAVSFKIPMESGKGGESGWDVMLEVIDTGVGIPEEALPLVWERYYKVHDFHKRANMGTGLGLSIVKNILVLHGAKFGVTSTVGRGSCFWFRLPLVRTQKKSGEGTAAGNP